MTDQDVNKQLEKLRRTLTKELRESVNDIRLNSLYQQLLMQHVFDRPEPLAAMTSWSIAPEFAWWLYQHVTTVKPGKIMELGSGTSTLVIAAALKKLGAGRFLSIEHDHAYFEKTQALLQVCDLQNHVELIYAPLEKWEHDGLSYQWYDLPFDMIDHMIGRNQLDLLLVDGPPAATNYHARYPAMVRLKDYCCDSTVILLDDAGREEEQQILVRWQALMGAQSSSQMLSNVRHGPAFFYLAKNLTQLSNLNENFVDAMSELIGQEVEQLIEASLLDSSVSNKRELVDPLLDMFYRLRERSLHALRLKYAAANERCLLLEGELGALKIKADQVVAENSKACAEILEKEEQVASLETVRQELLAQIEGLSQQQQDQSQRASLLDSELAVALTRALEAERGFSQLSVEHSEQLSILETLKCKVTDIQAVNDQANVRESLLLEKQQALQKQLDLANQAIDESQIRQIDLESHLTLLAEREADLIKELASVEQQAELKIQAAKEFIVSSMQPQLDGLKRINENQQQQLIKIQKQRDAVIAERDALKTQVVELAKRYKLVYKSLVYQLGMAFYRQSRTMISWAKMPLAISRVTRRHAVSGNPDIVEYQAPRLQLVKEPAKSRGVKKPIEGTHFDINSCSDGLKKIVKGVKSSTALWAASQIADELGYKAALQFAEKHVDKNHSPALGLMHANAVLDDEKEWLKNINAYLGVFSLAPVSLAKTPGARFMRLQAVGKLPFVEGPLITVIMPAFNAEKTLQHAVNSILAQTWRSFQLIIVDDYSGDNTLSIAMALAEKDSRIEVLHNPVNVGPYVSKNLALRIARGDYITGHDADDWAHPERLARHMRAILSEASPPKASLSGMIRVNELGAVTRFSKLGPNTQDGVMAGAFISCMFERGFLQNMLGSWEEVKFAGDSELIKRAERVLGGEIVRYNFLSMICLDTEGSLTNDPVHGYSPKVGLSESRLLFRDKFNSLHKELDVPSLYLDFPQVARRIDLPDEIRVSADSIRKAYLYHLAGKKNFDVSCDVCVVTDLCLPGGNASSTIDEINFYKSIGLKVLLIHCPGFKNQGRQVHERYLELKDSIAFVWDLCSVVATHIIVRHPRVICSPVFPSIASCLRADYIYAIINNSISTVDGGEVWQPSLLMGRLASVNARSVKVFPLSPGIRQELQSYLSPDLVADVDWSPTFSAAQFKFMPKRDIQSPFIIGRHGRDGREKWVESKESMAMVYPEDELFKIRILGGASHAFDILSFAPSNWEALPFGALSPEDYLSSIDFFVYFPNTNLNEAFGRTIVEAVFVGVPCILPFKFEGLFGSLAFYCEPKDVRSLVMRLATSPKHRLLFVTAAREFAVANYETSVLSRRIEGGGQDSNNKVNLDSHLLNYKKWVETGEGHDFE